MWAVYNSAYKKPHCSYKCVCDWIKKRKKIRKRKWWIRIKNRRKIIVYGMNTVMQYFTNKQLPIMH